jgi:hypothetical protein
MHVMRSTNAIPTPRATEEAWALLQQRYITHLLACGFQPSTACCSAGRAAPTLAGQCPTWQQTSGDGTQPGARGSQASESATSQT